MAWSIYRRPASPLLSTSSVSLGTPTTMGSPPPPECQPRKRSSSSEKNSTTTTPALRLRPPQLLKRPRPPRRLLRRPRPLRPLLPHPLCRLLRPLRSVRRPYNAPSFSVNLVNHFAGMLEEAPGRLPSIGSPFVLNRPCNCSQSPVQFFFYIFPGSNIAWNM